MCVCGFSRYKDGMLINQRAEFKKKRIRMHSNHALEIKDVCQEDSGLYTVALKNSVALLEKRLNISVVVNGMYLVFHFLQKDLWQRPGFLGLNFDFSLV